MRLNLLATIILVAFLMTLGCEKTETAKRDIEESTPTAKSARTRPVVGRDAPEIEGPDTDGVNFKLSDYRGKIVFLDFWGDW